jgi:hypothetical protein
MRLRDIRNLLAIGNLDRDYILGRVRKMGLMAIWREAVSE